jgi:hypothetical protein
MRAVHGGFPMDMRLILFHPLSISCQKEEDDRDRDWEGNPLLSGDRRGSSHPGRPSCTRRPDPHPRAGDDVHQPVTSMEIEHVRIREADLGQDIGIKVIERIHAGDMVFREN